MACHTAISTASPPAISTAISTAIHGNLHGSPRQGKRGLRFALRAHGLRRLVRRANYVFAPCGRGLTRVGSGSYPGGIRSGWDQGWVGSSPGGGCRRACPSLPWCRCRPVYRELPGLPASLPWLAIACRGCHALRCQHACLGLLWLALACHSLRWHAVEVTMDCRGGCLQNDRGSPRITIG